MRQTSSALFICIVLMASLHAACPAPPTCTKNADCASGQVCVTGTNGGTCSGRPLTCQSNADCSGATPTCNTTSGKCEATSSPNKCSSDADCIDASKPKCNTSIGLCERSIPCGCKSDADCTDAVNPKCENCLCTRGQDPNHCNSDADCTDSTRPKCNTTTWQCEANIPCGCVSDAECSGATPKCSNCRCVACLSDSDCPSGQTCEKKTCKGGCGSDADCSGSTPLCNTGTRQCVSCLSDGDCPAGSICSNNQCSGPCGCASDADCPNGSICKNCQCLQPPGTKNPGEKCSDAEGCVAGSQCLGISQTDPNERYCFQVCTADADCTDSFRNKCQPANDSLNVCLRESVKGEECGFTTPKQGTCKQDQNPPLYCSATAGKCLESVVQKNEGDPCSKEGDNTDPVKVCDTASGIACDEATGTCKKAQIAKEGEECDLSGANNGGTKILCDTGLTCIRFDSTGELNHCHAICDPNGNGSECTVMGTSCLPLLTDGRGLCMDNQCTADSDCAYPNYRCGDAQGGGKLCFPKEASGPVGFGGICKTPRKQFGCDTTTDAQALCLSASSTSTQGFCTRNCTNDNTCPDWDDGAGNKIPSTCTAIDTAGNKVCLFPCGQSGQTCPTGLTCQQAGVGTQTCLAP